MKGVIPDTPVWTVGGSGASGSTGRGSTTSARESAALKRLARRRPAAPVRAATPASAPSTAPELRKNWRRSVAPSGVSAAAAGDGARRWWISQSAPMPASAPTTLGRATWTGAPVRRLNAAHAPIAPKTATPATPKANRRRSAITPTTAAYRPRKIAIPINSAGLSFVPNVSMANSLTNGGAASIRRSPTSSTGERHERLSPASSSATASATAATTRPVSAPRVREGRSTRHVRRARRTGWDAALRPAEVLAQRVLLELVGRADVAAVQRVRRLEHPLEGELAHRLAVLDHERHVVGPHLERGPRAAEL